MLLGFNQSRAHDNGPVREQDVDYVSLLLWGPVAVTKETAPVNNCTRESSMKRRESSGMVVFLLVGFAGVVLVPAGTLGAEATTQKANQTPAVPKSLVQPASSATASPCDGSCNLPLPKNSGEPVYSVVSPLGDPTVKMITMAPRLDTLAGKTVCLVWNHTFKADITLPAIGEALKKKYPDIRIIPYTEIDAAVRAAGGERPWTEPAILQSRVEEERLQRSDQRKRRMRDLHAERGPCGHRSGTNRYSGCSGDRSGI